MSRINHLIVFICLVFLTVACKPSPEVKVSSTSPPVDSNDNAVVDSHIPNEANEINPSGRLAWQKPSLVIDKLGDLTGMTVADIGAGTGYFTFRFMRQAKKVIAVDIDPEMIGLIEMFKENLDINQQTKVETRLATEDDAKLWPEEADVIVIINTIGFIADPISYIAKLKRGLADNGRIMIVDFKIKRIPEDIAPPLEYRVGIMQLEDMLSRAGYRNIITDDTSLDYQYMILAQK